ncbi:MAG: glycine--tRNA ligase subunit beta [Candidatus Aminicenantes bacterium]|nr:MAG: glycine--tRNA ligase subunit beta [Candidatus Aminicenantes bacterium]
MEFLMEIMTEEMPPVHVKGALAQLEERLTEGLIANELVDRNDSYGKISVFGTCRRLIVHGIFVEKQQDKQATIIGPPKSVAFSDDGSAKPAATGFAKSQGVKVDDLEIVKTEKGDYVGINKIEEGKPTQVILEQILPTIIGTLSFPKMMRWSDSSFRFSRPIKSILCLCDRKPLRYSVNDISPTNHTTGHKIYSPKKLKVETFAEYKVLLKQNRVVIDPEERRIQILRQAERKLVRLEAKLHPDDQLLAKLTYDVEHPYVFMGSFPQEYLKLPLEVLSTAMREGQRLFSVLKGKKQLPYFLGVADAYKDPKFLIRKGNERVLKARLEDAKFFWEQDVKSSLKEKSKRLDQIVFQERLGSYQDKTDRLKKTVEYLADKLELHREKNAATGAAELCKVDLMTDMVREFPSLQGKMGGLYAKDEGYSIPIWKAIYEHYQPVSLDDSPPSSLTGSILSIADKLDTIVGTTGVGVEVTGSKDPFGIRRNAQGICKIILEKKLSFSFPRLLDKIINTMKDRLVKEKGDVKSYVLDFFNGRLQHIFESQGYRYDLVKASLAPGIDNIYHSYLRLKALDSLKDSPQFEPMIIIAKRVNNILRDQSKHKVNEELLLEKQERELHTTFSIIRDNILPLIAIGDFSKAQRMIFRMRSSINDFFDHVLVMADDKKLRRNRLALLQEISQLLGRIADYSLVVIEG